MEILSTIRGGGIRFIFRHPSIGILAIVLAAPSPALTQEVVDNSTLKGKVICGYQGWFNCPGDGSSPGNIWVHWSRSGESIGPGLYTVEMWPDLSECDPDELYRAGGVTLTNGKPGHLFSSANLKTVTRHFKWMRDAGIDGVFLQRFICETRKRADEFKNRNIVLNNVRQAANTFGRVFALEYDCINVPNTTLFKDITRDWKYLADTHRITADPRYLRHNGKPVVIIWGLGFKSSSRDFSPELSLKIIDFFRNDPVYGGNYCIGGVPSGWRTLEWDARTDTRWTKVYRKWDALLPWTVGRYRTPDEVHEHKAERWEPDIRLTKRLGIEYIPVVWPGFSWDNLKELPHNDSIKRRLGGKYLWSQVHAVCSAGAETIFVAMFDEVDEATAVFKVSDTHPTTGHWITNEGLPNDWYMRLAGAAGEMLRGQIPLTADIPIDPDCNGDRVSFNFGENQGDHMTHLLADDGNTKPIKIEKILCCRNKDPQTDRHMYMGVDDRFAYRGNRPVLSIIVDYYDADEGALGLQYDSNCGHSVESIYKFAGSVNLAGTKTFKRHIFNVADAYFGNRQNQGADFRIVAEGVRVFYVDRVTVASTIPRPPKIKLSTRAFKHAVVAGKSLPEDKITLVNSGVAPLNYTINDNASWLSVSPLSGRNTGEPDIMIINYDTATLPPGQYSAVVTIEGPRAPNSPQDVEIILNVVTPSR